MPRFYFDTTDGDALIEDETGLELSDLDEAKAEAARALADLARDVLPASEVRELAVNVKDEANTLVMRTVLRFEVVQIA